VSHILDQLRACIKGKVQRDLARRILADEGPAGLTALIAREELPDEERWLRGLQRKSCFGGERLSSEAGDAVDIAQIIITSAVRAVISSCNQRPTLWPSSACRANSAA
jgi:hypothetical protein